MKCSSQSILENTSLTLGGYLHEINTLEDGFGRGYEYTVVSPEIGISYKLSKIPISFSYRRNFNYGIEANENIEFNKLYFEASDYSDYNEIDEFNIYYHKRGKKINYAVGFGYYHKKWITAAYFISRGTNGTSLGNNFEHKAITFSFLLKLKALNIEFKKYAELYPSFNLIESYLYGISVFRAFHLKKPKQVQLPTDFTKGDNFFIYTSLRLQAIKYHQQNPDLYNFFGFSLGLGIGYYIKPDLTIILSRDVWKRLTGGTSVDDLIGYISTTNFMIRKHQQLANGKRFYYGLGWHPIRNSHARKKSGEKTVTHPDTGLEVTLPFTKYTNVYGIGISMGYELSDNFDIEWRQILPYEGDYFFNPYYMTFGINYCFR